MSIKLQFSNQVQPSLDSTNVRLPVNRQHAGNTTRPPEPEVCMCSAWRSACSALVRIFASCTEHQGLDIMQAWSQGIRTPLRALSLQWPHKGLQRLCS